MLRKFIIGVATFIVPTVSLAQQAQQGQFGTAEEAKAMLEKAAAAVKADKATALAMFNKGDARFNDRDLYPFCFNSADGRVTAGPVPPGTDVRTLKDKAGKAFGEELFKTAKEESISEVSSMFPRRGNDVTSIHKGSFVIKVGDQVCGVEYYK